MPSASVATNMTTVNQGRRRAASREAGPSETTRSRRGWAATASAPDASAATASSTPAATPETMAYTPMTAPAMARAHTATMTTRRTSRRASSCAQTNMRKPPPTP